MARRGKVRPAALKVFPSNLGDCINGTYSTGSRAERMEGRRQCDRLMCSANLLWRDKRDMPGKTHAGLGPPGTTEGKIVSASAPSCAYDVIDAYGPMPLRDVAKYVGGTRRDAELTLIGAIEKLQVAGADQHDIDKMTALAFAHPSGNEAL